MFWDKRAGKVNSSGFYSQKRQVGLKILFAFADNATIAYLFIGKYALIA